LARMMIGQPFEVPPAPAAEPWPSWYADLTQFFQGANHHLAGDAAAAQAAFHAYMNSDGSPAWPYAFKPLAQSYLDNAQDWVEKRSQIDDLLNQRQPDSALNLLRDAQRKYPAWFKKEIDDLAQRTRQMMAEIARAKQDEDQTETEARQQEEAEAERRRQAQIELQRQLDRLDAIRESALTSVAQKEFRQAAERIEQDTRELTLPEARQMAGFLKESFDLLDSGKQFIIQSFPRRPYVRGRSEIGGEAVSANQQLIQLRIGSVGSAQKTWAEIPPRVYVDMLSFYIATVDNPRPKAELTLGLSLYAYYTGNYPYAQRYAEMAVQLNPDLKRKALQLMPGILPQ
jgi:hypothetical protein